MSSHAHRSRAPMALLSAGLALAGMLVAPAASSAASTSHHALAAGRPHAAQIRSRDLLPVAPGSPITTTPLSALTAPPAQPGVGGLSISGELAAERTANSRTYLAANGQRLAVVYPGPVNYETSTGQMAPIDDTAVASGTGGWHNAANSFSVSAPSTLSSPLKVSGASGTLGLTLEGGTGVGSAAGSTVSYAGVMANVSASAAFSNTGVDESLLLASSDAPTSYSWSISESAGLTATSSAAGIAFRNAAAALVATILPPSVFDASHNYGPAPVMTLSPDGSTLTISLAPDAAWLSSPQRTFPVTLDPSISTTLQSGSDCTLASAHPTSSSCGASGDIQVGSDSTYGTAHGIVRFDNLTSAIPYDSTVLGAHFYVHVDGADNANEIPVGISTLTRAWTSGATWDTYDGTNAWTTPGGDTVSDPTVSPVSMGSAPGWYYFDPTERVQSWVSGENADGSTGLSNGAQNEGFLLSSTSTANLLQITDFQSSSSANWPYLLVYYSPRTGTAAPLDVASSALTDKTTLGVNLANGNAVVDTSDFTVNGPGLPLHIDHVYNSLGGTPTQMGSTSWSLNASADGPYLEYLSGSTALVSADGLTTTFIDTGGSSHVSPPGINATLVGTSSTSYTLTDNKTQQVQTFEPESSGSTIFLLSSVKDRNGNTISYAYNSSHELTTITDTEGREVTLSWSGGLLSSITNSASQQATFTYTSGQLTGESYAGATYAYGYDANGNLNKITDPLGHITTLTYDAAHRVTSVTRVTNTSTMTGPTTDYTYSPGSASSPKSGSMVVTDPDGNQTTYYYDAFDRVTSVKDALGYTRAKTYTPNADISSTTDALSNVSNFSYDTLNNLTKITEPPTASGQTPASQSLSYATPSSASGYQYLPSSSTDAESNCTAYTYDANGNMTASYGGQSSPCDGATGGVSSVNKYQGDPGVSCGGKPGALCSTTDGNGHTTSYAYYADGDLETVTPPSPQGATTLYYPSSGNLSLPSKIVSPSGTVNITYDAWGRVTELAYTSGPTVSYTYDDDGNLTAMTDAYGTVTYTYDALNRLTNQSINGGIDACAGSSPSGIVLTYDAASNITSYCDGGGTVTYGYNADNEVTSLAEPGGNCGSSPTWCTTFSYDKNGNRTVTTTPQGATQTFAYNGAGNVSSVVATNSSGGPIDSYAYTYAKGANDTSLVQQMTATNTPADGTYSYTYDALNRLTSDTVGGTTTNWSYDAAGNRCSASTSCSSPTYTYNAANELTSGPAGSYSWNSAGSETASPQLSSLAYNTANQTTSMTPTGGSAAAMTYRGIGQSWQVEDGGVSYVTGPLGVTRWTKGSTIEYIVRDPLGNPIGFIQGSDHYFYMTDKNGSITAVIYQDGGVNPSDQYAYDPWGQIINDWQYGAPNPLGFDGGLVDPPGGLIKIGERYYDPSTGRWTQTDPISGAITTPQTLNGYPLAGDNPVNFVDPSGMCIKGLGWFCQAGSWLVASAEGVPGYVHGLGIDIQSAAISCGEGISESLSEGADSELPPDADVSLLRPLASAVGNCLFNAGNDYYTGGNVTKTR